MSGTSNNYKRNQQEIQRQVKEQEAYRNQIYDKLQKEGVLGSIRVRLFSSHMQSEVRHDLIQKLHGNKKTNRLELPESR